MIPKSSGKLHLNWMRQWSSNGKGTQKNEKKYYFSGQAFEAVKQIESFPILIALEFRLKLAS